MTLHKIELEIGACLGCMYATTLGAAGVKGWLAGWELYGGLMWVPHEYYYRYGCMHRTGQYTGQCSTQDRTGHTGHHKVCSD